MIFRTSQNVKSLISNNINTKAMSHLSNPRKKFITKVLWLFLCIKGKINFLQMERFGQDCEQTFRNQFEDKFDFITFNNQLIEGVIGDESIIAFDPSYIPKAGKKTPNIGRFWSGTANASKHGLEICGFAVVDVQNKNAFHLNAFQSPGASKLGGKDSTLLDHYCSIIISNAGELSRHSNYFVADAYFSKLPVVNAVLGIRKHLISRMRDDSVLMYKYHGAKSGKKGRPKKFEGRVDVQNPDLDYFEKHEQEGLVIYSAIVYSRAFKQDIKLAITVFTNENKQEVSRKLYFSTDTEQTGEQIVRFYRSRFQIEFLYRDAKQHTGLTNCQARSENKLDFHFNASLTAVNIAKVDWINNKSMCQKSFSLSSYKTLCYNALLLERFILKFAINPNHRKNRKIIDELLEYGKIAA